jgi:hypothetical protein
LGQARNAAEEAASGFATSVEREARALVDEAGPAAGLVLTALALKHLSLLQGTLEEQRESLREPVAQAESEMARAFKAVEMAASRSRFGWLRGLRKPLAAYLSAASLAFRLRYAFDLTEAVLAALSQADEHLREFQPRLQGMLDRFALVRDRCRRWTQEFESYEPTPVTEIIQRPLYETAQLQRLYRDSYATDWGTTSQEMEGAVRQSLGGLSLWLDSEDQTIYAALIEALLPVFEPTIRMTADDFVRWLSAVGETSPELLLRDSELLAPVLCRYDRARLPDSGAFEDTAFRILGVPDRDCSAFSGVADVLLVSTGDPDRIVHLSLKLGFPASALWHHERYQRAAEEVRRRGRVAQQIYPDFPYDGRRDPPPDDEHGAGGRARGRRRPAQQRPGRPEEGRDER